MKFLQILNAIEKYPTLSKCAKSLYVTQPYLSTTITAQEKKYNAKLVNRDTKPISLTESGKIVQKYLIQEDIQEKKLHSALQEQNDHKLKSVAIGGNQDLLLSISASLINLLHNYNPKLRIILKSMTTPVAKKALLTNEIDIYLGEEIIDEKIESKKLYNVGVCLLVSKNSSLYEVNKRVRPWKSSILNSLKNELLIGQSFESLYTTIVNDYLIKQGFEPHYQIIADNTDSMIKLPLEGIGCCIAPTFFNENLLKNALPYNIFEIPAEAIVFQQTITYLKEKKDLFKETIDLISKFLYKKRTEQQKRLRNNP